MNIRKFFMKDVRCFAGEHWFNIRPLTFLVGENSTGKSTVLGCLQALVDCTSAWGARGGIDFNSEPYEMGAFGDIVRLSKPKNQRFELGVEYQHAGSGLGYHITMKENRKGSDPIIERVKWKFGKTSVLVCEKPRPEGLDADIHYGVAVKNGGDFDIEVYNKVWLHIFSNSVIHFLYQEGRQEAHSPLANLLQKEHSRLSRLQRVTVSSIAPIRSKPKRTYNPTKAVETSEGSEIPVVMMNLTVSAQEQWKNLKARMEGFGKASGLFKSINIRHLGSANSDPFQLQIVVRGPKANIMDVGYGISQILPIMVRILMEKNTHFLLQQPEVHLHPKGQAALTSLLVDDIKQQKNAFVVETHSDYMIDRARIEIMQGNISPDDVSLIYLEPCRNKVDVHNITFDDRANMIGAPPSYREFFLRESDKLLGISGG